MNTCSWMLQSGDFITCGCTSWKTVTYFFPLFILHCLPSDRWVCVNTDYLFCLTSAYFYFVTMWILRYYSGLIRVIIILLCSEKSVQFFFNYIQAFFSLNDIMKKQKSLLESIPTGWDPNSEYQHNRTCSICLMLSKFDAFQWAIQICRILWHHQSILE